jgi:hypothetical protein
VRFSSYQLDRLEEAFRLAGVGVAEEVDEKERAMILESAIHANECGAGEEFGRWPLFDITEDGSVFSNVDGKQITTCTGVLAEQWYWEQVHYRSPHLTYDEDQETFFDHDGDFALSRDRVSLPHYFGRACKCRACLEWREGRGG